MSVYLELFWDTHPKRTPFVAATISKSLSSGNISNLRVKYSLPKEYCKEKNTKKDEIKSIKKTTHKISPNIK